MVWIPTIPVPPQLPSYLSHTPGVSYVIVSQLQGTKDSGRPRYLFRLPNLYSTFTSTFGKVHNNLRRNQTPKVTVVSLIPNIELEKKGHKCSIRN